LTHEGDYNMSGHYLIRVAVIGGGASGIVAAIAAARKGADVTILEKNQRIGRKILATGNGRCNLTNIDLSITNFHGKNPKFAFAALSRFDFKATIEFFEQLGIVYKIEEGGKVFPVSNQASSVLDVLRYELEKTGVKTICEAGVVKIKKRRADFEICLGDGRVYYADRVIIATGGRAAPHFGSNGSGYALAKSLGHTIVEPFPALVQLKLASNYLKHLQGVKFEGGAELIVDGRAVQAASGEILFTAYGISGPPIFCLSRKAGEFLQNKKNVSLKLQLVNTLTPEELEDLLTRRFQSGPGKSSAFSFVGYLNKKLAQVVLKEAGVDINKPAGQITAAERKKIVHYLKDWRFPVTGNTSWPAAQVTAGGVDVKDIDGSTMESKLTSGLYFAGEVVDIDGDCGGYNLQWAWSSGYIAGENAALP
jgi:predicted Rossmann fold flavoprotein